MTRNKGLQSDGLTVVLNTQKNDKRMSKGFFKILIYLILFATTVGYSQKLPWTAVQETTIFEDIEINTTQSLYEGDTLLLGAFYSKSPGFFKCGGYARVPGDSVLRVYGKDAYNDGFLNGEEYQFRVYNPKMGCYMVLGSYNSSTFGNPVYLDVSSLTVALPSVVYPQIVSCRSKEDLFPIIIDNLAPTFSSTPYGLAIDSLTGTINTENSRPGEYKVKAVTESCLANDTFSITITEGKNLLESSDTTICEETGEIGAFYFNESNIYVWNTGDSSQSININKPGEYWVKMIDTMGCLSQDTMVVNLLPKKILGNDTVICTNTITLNAPDGYFYQWNTGNQEKSITVDTSGLYTVKTGNEFCTVLDSIFITLKKPVQFDLGKDTSVLCLSPFNLSGPPGYKYQWETGDHSQTIQVNKSGKYYLTLIDGDGCKSIDSITVDFSKAADMPAINLGSDTIVCASSFIIKSNTSGVSYTWSTGEKADSIKVQATGIYTLTVKDQNGCSNSDDIAVEFKDGFSVGNISVEIINPPCNENISVKLNPDSLYGAFPYTYDLIKDGFVVSNSPNGIFNNVQEGNYNFEIRDSQGCKALSSNNIITVKKAEPCPEKVLAFTGTSQPSYFIGFPGTTKIYDMSGLLIKTIPTPAEWDGTGNNGEVVPMGDYIIVCGENQKIVVTVIK
ncbi:MAG: hypothetical protein J7604_26785 [Sporocytophaga sp.]|uniref:hypothetical protein n=1 Tax=Sporocytophaga sp. TaxID=2231183 RepID=UPI001B2E9F23|nr:hypothetical protein [Sporocytophaga sp.]MBO9703842.1 hypothetical protein [Sporocytophaga sp.]